MGIKVVGRVNLQSCVNDEVRSAKCDKRCTYKVVLVREFAFRQVRFFTVDRPAKEYQKNVHYVRKSACGAA